MLHCIYVLVDGHLICFHLLAVINSAFMSIHVHVFVWTYVLISLDYIPASRLARSYGNSVF